MTNKLLLWCAGGIAVVAAAAIFIISYDARHPEGLFFKQPVTSSDRLDNGVSEGQCKRDFDPAKLKKASVDLKNREVSIDIKDFGTVKIALYDQDAPKAVENFLRLVNSGYYDCLTFHRVAKGFVIQGGDPSGNGKGGESAFGVEFGDEINPSSDLYKKGYVKGVVAMANRGPNTNTSQFFIVLSDDANKVLDKKYTIFGHVTSGMEAVDKVGQVDIIPFTQADPTDGSPKDPVIMQKVTITK